MTVVQQRAARIQKLHDILWNKCNEKGWFDQAPGLKDYLLWVEHEVSRETDGLKNDH